jgi:multimeric flavodoxin WrbA
MKVLGIFGSPRKGGNSDTLLEEALKGALSVGAEVSSIRCCELNITGCHECGGCDKTGKCVVDDDMQSVYPQLLEADAIILASPIFFYGIPAQAKAVIDRCQAMWCKRLLEKPDERRKIYDGGRGYLICVGATKGKNLFDGSELVAKYWYDALDMSYEGGVLIKAVEGKGDILKHPDAMQQAFDLGKDAAGKDR